MNRDQVLVGIIFTLSIDVLAVNGVLEPVFHDDLRGDDTVILVKWKFKIQDCSQRTWIPMNEINCVWKNLFSRTNPHIEQSMQATYWLERTQTEAWKSTCARNHSKEKIHKVTEEGNLALREETLKVIVETLSSAEISSHSRNSIRTRLQKVRCGRGNSTPCKENHFFYLKSSWRSQSGK